MNYAEHYERLIGRAKLRSLDGYRERHHIVPRCMGGGNELGNIAELTPEEHYVAHQLLVKMYPEVGGLALATILMARKAVGMRAYGWLARRHSESMRGHKRNVGQKRTAEQRARISASLVGRTFSPEHRAAISAVQKGKKKSKEHGQKSGAARRGKKLSQERIAAMIGRVHSKETREKCRASRLRVIAMKRDAAEKIMVTGDPTHG